MLAIPMESQITSQVNSRFSALMSTKMAHSTETLFYSLATSAGKANHYPWISLLA
jgi:hypothetical protein